MGRSWRVKLADRHRQLVVLTAVIGAFALPFLLLRPDMLVVSFDYVTATDTQGSLLGLMVGMALMWRFLSLGNRFHLVVGMAFLISGMEDLINGLVVLNESQADQSLQERQFVYESYVTGQLLMGLTLLVAVFLGGRPEDDRRLADVGNTLGVTALVLTLMGLVVLVVIPLPHLSLGQWFADRREAVDLALALVLTTALGGYLLRYLATSDPLTWWVAASLGVSIVGQLLMLTSRGIEGTPADGLDFYFWLAHFYKVATYMLALIGVISGQITSVVESRVSQRELLLAREAAESTGRAKSLFLANMSHEIRTPMNGILGMLRRVLRGELTRPQREDLTIAHDSAQTLLKLLNNILDFSKMEVGKLTLTESVFSPHKVLSEATGPWAMLAREKGLEFSLQISDRMPAWGKGDAERLGQVMVNLLSNAVKFTATGQVKVQADWQQGEELGLSRLGDSWLTIAVTDTGPGVPESQRAKIFQAFSQVENDAQSGSSLPVGQANAGTGLGLAIVAELVQLMKGELLLTSEVGVGSRFELILPLQAVADGPNEPMEPTSRVDLAGSIDQPATDARPLKTGSEVLSHGQQISSPPPVPKSQFPSPILLAEDDPVSRQLTKSLLEEMGHQVLLASTGAEVLEIIGSQPAALILMDVRMPVMDGLESARQLRLAEQWSPGRRPILALTAQADETNLSKILGAGIDDCLIKPVDENTLFHTVEKYLALTFGASSTEKPDTYQLAPPQEEFSETSATPAPVEKPPAYDLTDIRRQTGGNEELMEELIRLAVRQTKQLLESIRKARHDGKRSELARHVHQLTGSLSPFGAQELVHRGRALEKDLTLPSKPGLGNATNRTSQVFSQDEARSIDKFWKEAQRVLGGLELELSAGSGSRNSK